MKNTPDSWKKLASRKWNNFSSTLDVKSSGVLGQPSQSAIQLNTFPTAFSNTWYMFPTAESRRNRVNNPHADYLPPTVVRSNRF